MTGDKFRAVRFKLGLSSLEWGLALGYAGKPDNIRTVTLIGVELSAKRLELMRELLPGAVEVAAR
jgi:hypothetical protein